MDPRAQKDIFEGWLHLEPCENWSMATLEQATADAGKPRDHLTARNNSQLFANYTKKFCSLLDKERALAYDPNSRSQIC